MYSRNQTLINLIQHCDKNRQTIMSYDLEKQVAVIRSQIGETSGLITLKGDELKRLGEKQ